MPFTVLDESLAAAAFTTTAGAPLTDSGETLVSLREELQEQLGNRDNVDETRLDRWINWAYRNVCSMLTLKELMGSAAVDVVADQPFYLVPPQLSWVDYLAVSDSTTYPISEGRELAKIDLDIYRKLDVLAEEPRQYFRWRRMLVLWPTPLNDRTLACEFKVRPDDLVNDDDSPLLPQEFHEAILLSARHRGFRSVQDYKQAQMALNDFLACIRPLQNTDAEETVTANATLTPIRSRRGLYRREG